MWNDYEKTESKPWPQRPSWKLNQQIKDFSNIVCIRHIDYDGMTAPEMDCPICRARYVGRIVDQMKQQGRLKEAT